ncbi:SNAP receptor use1 [Rhizophlyctis rosea]|uniref:SNAP receptor use1 n=1 Tax=Rhizophlyctis rosea TaxID=64517 RepID=A0AAD5SEL9_9FUNG|nr:SNAP receptor use1 [Rhizophlyctis rosea]
MPTHAEVNLRRLLLKCDTLLEDNDLQSRRKLETNVTYLKKLLQEVENDPNRQMDATKFCEYQQRVELMHGLLDDQKLISSTTRTLIQLRNAAAASAKPNLEVVGGVDRILRIQRTAEHDLREYLMEGLSAKRQTKTQKAPEPTSTPTSNAPRISLAEAREELLSSPSLRIRPNARRPDTSPSHELSSLSTTADPESESLLEHNRKLQDDMTEELVRMAAALKNNTLSIGEKLQKDRKVLDEASTNLETSVGRLKKEKDRLGKLNMSARNTTWLIWGAILLVCIVFTVTFMFMRLVGKRSVSTSV